MDADALSRLEHRAGRERSTSNCDRGTAWIGKFSWVNVPRVNPVPSSFTSTVPSRNTQPLLRPPAGIPG
ncbi:hypothetical protein C8E97_4722 [Saccharothrix australiensis]|uniref:Uncharacterized protein n=1 Tax=Saccharothrix australiensis TaxID=2072 RepID=A0A495W3U8_9PSEU|nr:hypothetical protein C8E97_4722 [Saccharothrix australiensis]